MALINYGTDLTSFTMCTIMLQQIKQFHLFILTE